jgi:hypothetical protein
MTDGFHWQNFSCVVMPGVMPFEDWMYFESDPSDAPTVDPYGWIAYCAEQAQIPFGWDVNECFFCGGDVRKCKGKCE